MVMVGSGRKKIRELEISHQESKNLSLALKYLDHRGNMPENCIFSLTNNDFLLVVDYIIVQIIHCLSLGVVDTTPSHCRQSWFCGLHSHTLKCFIQLWKPERQGDCMVDMWQEWELCLFSDKVLRFGRHLFHHSLSLCFVARTEYHGWGNLLKKKI